MSLHPEKAQWALRITKRKELLQSVYRLLYHLHNHTHITNTVNKASMPLGILRRNPKKGCTAIKERTLVRPSLGHTSSVWDPYMDKKRYRLEIVEHRAARWVTN